MPYPAQLAYFGYGPENDASNLAAHLDIVQCIPQTGG